MSGTGTRSLEDDWVLAAFGIDPSSLPSATQPATAGDGATGWADARATVLQSLKSLENAIKAMKNPLGDKAIILVKSIAANLTAAPSTHEQVAELRRYLESDSVIGDAEAPNGFGIQVKIRAPLLASLATLEQGLPG